MLFGETERWVAQLGVIYRFRVRERGNAQAQWRLLGDIDEAGTRLIDVLPTALRSVDHRVDVPGLTGPQPSVTFDRHLPAKQKFYEGAVFNHHEYGARGLLNRFAQGDTYPFTEKDNRQTEIALAASARPQSPQGFVAFQVADGRSIKSGVEQQLKAWLRDNFDLFLEFTPVAPTEAVEAAIQRGGLGPVTFRKLDQPADAFANDADWWGEGTALAVSEHRIRPARHRRFPGGDVLRYIQTRRGTLPDEEQPVDFPELAVFDGHEYDQLAVEITLHGRKKTVYFGPDGHSMSHAFSWDLGIEPSAGDDERFEALAELLANEGE